MVCVALYHYTLLTLSLLTLPDVNTYGVAFTPLFFLDVHSYIVADPIVKFV
jgi:hypothetical protein